MTSLEKCLQTLRVLIRESDIGGIVLAERAIDEFVDSETCPDRQTEALNVLDQETTKIWRESAGKGSEFANLVSDYIARRIRALRKDQ